MKMDEIFSGLDEHMEEGEFYFVADDWQHLDAAVYVRRKL